MTANGKRVVSTKPIVPEIQEAEVTPEPVIAPSVPKLRLLVTETYLNYAIGDGIHWLAGTEHDVDFSTFQRLMNDNPDIFVRVG